MRHFIAVMLLATCFGAAAADVTKPVLVDDKNYAEEVADYKGFVIVDYHASWCKPCRDFAPEFDLVADDIKDVAKAVSVDVDVAPKSSATAYKIPKIVIYKDGKEIAVFDAQTMTRDHVGVEKWARDVIKANSK